MDLWAEFGFLVASLSLLFYVDSVISSWISHSLKAGVGHMVGATECRITINWHETTFLIFLSFYSNPNYTINFARVDSMIWTKKGSSGLACELTKPQAKST